MIRLLKEISKTQNIETGLKSFFQSFDNKEEALIFWRDNFEKSEDNELITKVFKQAK